MDRLPFTLIYSILYYLPPYEFFTLEVLSQATRQKLVSQPDYFRRLINKLMDVQIPN
jgi:hypothetical protein